MSRAHKRGKPKMLQFSDSGTIINLGIKDGMVRGIYNTNVLQAPQSLEFTDYFDKTEMKIKDGQIKRLQGQVKNKLDQEQNLKTEIQSINRNDTHLIKKLEHATCYG